MSHCHPPSHDTKPEERTGGVRRRDTVFKSLSKCPLMVLTCPLPVLCVGTSQWWEGRIPSCHLWCSSSWTQIYGWGQRAALGEAEFCKTHMGRAFDMQSISHSRLKRTPKSPGNQSNPDWSIFIWFQLILSHRIVTFDQETLLYGRPMYRIVLAEVRDIHYLGAISP